MLREERSPLCERESEGDLDLDSDDLAGVRGSLDSELDKADFALKGGERVFVTKSGTLAEGDSLGDLNVCSGGCGWGVSLGFPCPYADEGVIDMDVPYFMRSSSFPLVCNELERIFPFSYSGLQI